MASLAVSVWLISECTPPKPFSLEAQEALRKMCPDDEKLTRVIQGMQSGWKDYYSPHPCDPNLCVQKYYIKGLKVYYDEKHQLVADFVTKDDAEKEECYLDYKSTRRVCKIFEDGTVRCVIRYANSGKKENFPYFLKNELEIRKQLGSVPHLLPLSHSGSYISKKHETRKDRFEVPYYNDNLLALASKDQVNGKSLRIFQDALSVLEKMHDTGFVHANFRPKSIVFTDNEGFLGDFSLAIRMSDPCADPYVYYEFREKLRDCRFAPPEVNIVNHPQNDMFSVGGSLIQMYRGDLFDKYLSIQTRYWRERELPQKSKEERSQEICEFISAYISELQHQLRDPNGLAPHDLSLVAADLIEPDSMEIKNFVDTKLSQINEKEWSLKTGSQKISELISKQFIEGFMYKLNQDLYQAGRRVGCFIEPNIYFRIVDWVEKKLTQRRKENWSREIRELQHQLRDPHGPEPHALSLLAAELIDPDQEMRPTCRQTIARLSEIIQKLSGSGL